MKRSKNGKSGRNIGKGNMKNDLYENYKSIWHCKNPSRNLKEIKKIVKGYLQGYDYKSDNVGNIFIGDFEKERPCLVAHLDSVFDKTPQNVRLKDGILKSSSGIGADDKCGIITILEVLKENNNINAILTVDEEIGGLGARNIKNETIKNVCYFIEIDRNGKSDIVDAIYGDRVASYDFMDDIEDLIRQYKFKMVDGAYTDILDLSNESRISSINLSSGYYNPHTKNEYVVLKDLQHTINFVKEILKTTTKKYDLPELVYNDDINTLYALDDVQDIKTLIDLSMFAEIEDIETFIQKAYEIGKKEKQYLSLSQQQDILYFKNKYEYDLYKESTI